MKIYEYYRDTANLSLNGSIAALFPAILIVGGNLSFLRQQEIFTFTIPFLAYSFICFQIYLFKKNRSLLIGRQMKNAKSSYQSVYEANHLLVLFLNTNSPRLMLYFPDGYLAGEIRRHRVKGIGFFSKMYVLYNSEKKAIGYFKISKEKIGVFNHSREYVGCFRKSRLGFLRNKKELLDASGKVIAAIEGSRVFMDEKVLDKSNKPVTRLRRGWMPLEWERYFPEPNTPVLSFAPSSSEKDKLLEMSFLIHEYFIER